jgi:UDP-N-acetylmuramyl tripeptide synthase
VANPFIIALGKGIRALARLRGSGAGGGSALPGLVVERLSPQFATRILERLPHGVVLVSGTNGKTTTTKAVAELLASQGMRVFTNNTGSNFMRGVISALLARVTLLGRLDADIAVLELDEAHAVRFVQAIRPRYALLLNVMRDQLDRYGEIDRTAQFLATVAEGTEGCVVANREDRRIAALCSRGSLRASLRWFGLAPDLRARFPQDDDLWVEGRHEVPASAEAQPDADVVLCEAEGSRVALLVAGEEGRLHADLALKGLYNAYNAAAALAVARAVIEGEGLGPPCTRELMRALQEVRSAFGRGEAVCVDGHSVELLLVKNPGGFRLALDSFDAAGHLTMIAINDNTADGHDMSWLYDVSFVGLRATGVAMVSGVRGFDMALRLAYDGVPVEAVECGLRSALDAFLALPSELPRRIYCTYTAMLELRRLMAGKTPIEKVS